MTRQSKNIFLREFLKHPGMTGAIAATSPKLAEKVISRVALEHANLIVEYGPGTGALTKEILEHVNPDATFIGIEKNPRFATYLATRFPGMTVIQDSAENISAHLKGHGMNQVDCVISAIPFTPLPARVRENIIRKTYEILKPNGTFLTYQYAHALSVPAGQEFRKLLKFTFDDVSMQIVWSNLPPAAVYICRKTE